MTLPRAEPAGSRPARSRSDRARLAHGLVAVVAWTAIALQLVLVVSGSAVLAEQDPPGLATRLARFVSYFTVQSNLLVAVASTALARSPSLDVRWWRVARVAGLVGITVTGLVHFFLLRPLLHLDGADWVADTMLHMVVPSLAVLVWARCGPRPRIVAREAAIALCWPVAWLVWTLLVGQVTGWVPYPFLDADVEGGASVALVCLGVTVLFVAILALVAWLDRRLAPAPGGDAGARR